MTVPLLRTRALPLIRLPACLASHRDIARWSRRTPAERLAGAHFSRAKRLNGGKPNGWWSARQWLALVESAGSRCYWCGAFTDQPSPDHLVPLACGGRNSIANLVVSCRRCQSRRQDKSAEEFVAYLATHPDSELDAGQEAA
jgi:5-methylcytosine-specific restriction endonuclease McrA